jgi:hypothetical protein
MMPKTNLVDITLPTYRTDYIEPELELDIRHLIMKGFLKIIYNQLIPPQTDMQKVLDEMKPFMETEIVKKCYPNLYHLFNFISENEENRKKFAQDFYKLAIPEFQATEGGRPRDLFQYPATMGRFFTGIGQKGLMLKAKEAEVISELQEYLYDIGPLWKVGNNEYAVHPNDQAQMENVEKYRNKAIDFSVEFDATKQKEHETKRDAELVKIHERLSTRCIDKLQKIFDYFNDRIEDKEKSDPAKLKKFLERWEHAKVLLQSNPHDSTHLQSLPKDFVKEAPAGWSDKNKKYKDLIDSFGEDIGYYNEYLDPNDERVHILMKQMDGLRDNMLELEAKLEADQPKSFGDSVKGWLNFSHKSSKGDAKAADAPDSDQQAQGQRPPSPSSR